MPDLPTTEASVLIAQDGEEDRYLPEGPRGVTVGGREALAWVNIQTAHDSTCGVVHLRFWDTGERRTIPQPARPGFLLPTDRPGVVFVGREKELGTLDLQTGEWETCGTIPDVNPRTIVNDGEVVPGGRAVVFGTKDILLQDPIANLYLFTLADRRVTVLAGGQVCSNGKVFGQGAGGLMLFDIDTPRRCVSRYRFDPVRRTANPDGVATDLYGIDGFPDGMVDVGDGTVIIAIFDPAGTGPGKAYRYSLSSGEPCEQWTVPGSPRVTCPLLVPRAGGVQLVMTTASEGMPDNLRRHCPNAGNLFIADTTLSQAPAVEMLRWNG
jgi:sugar lactone lactonase YvrE